MSTSATFVYEKKPTSTNEPYYRIPSSNTVRRPTSHSSCSKRKFSKKGSLSIRDLYQWSRLHSSTLSNVSVSFLKQSENTTSSPCVLAFLLNDFFQNTKTGGCLISEEYCKNRVYIFGFSKFLIKTHLEPFKILAPA